jgi:hypothetical protein
MKAPKCPLCGKEHLGLGRCPDFATEPKVERANRAAEALTIKAAEVITKSPPVITKSKAETKSKAGRQPIGSQAMTGYQRFKKHRAKRAASRGAS